MPPVLTDTTTIRLRLPADAGQADRSYDIVVGSGVIGSVGPAIAATGARRTVVITDAAVADSHAATTADAFSIKAFARGVPETLRIGP